MVEVGSCCGSPSVRLGSCRGIVSYAGTDDYDEDYGEKSRLEFAELGDSS